MKSESLRGHLRTLVLGAIGSAEPIHGYAIITALGDLTDGVLAFKEGAIYPALHQLEAEAIIESEWDTSTGRRRRVYRLTERGREALQGEADDWSSFRDAVDRVLKEVPWLTKK